MERLPTFSDYQGFIFDLDGTLVDSMPLHLAAWEFASAQFDYEYDADWFLSLGGVPSRKIVARLNQAQGKQLDIEAVAKVKSSHYLANIDQSELIAATFDVVQRYHGQIPMAVGTGSPRVNAARILERTGLARYVDILVSADDVTSHKPNPDTFLLAAERLGIDPQHCLVFEDTEIGRQAALAAGMDCILVKNGKLEYA